MTPILIAKGIDPRPTHTPARARPAGDPALAARCPLVLMTSKSALHFLNSRDANLRRQLHAEREPLLDMHADDGTARGIANGDTLVEVVRLD